MTGLPEPEPNHAVIMVRFGWDCLRKMHQVTRDMETTLGPGKPTGILQPVHLPEYFFGISCPLTTPTLPLLQTRAILS